MTGTVHLLLSLLLHTDVKDSVEAILNIPSTTRRANVQGKVRNMLYSHRRKALFILFEENVTNSRVGVIDRNNNFKEYETQCNCTQTSTNVYDLAWMDTDETVAVLSDTLNHRILYSDVEVDLETFNRSTFYPFVGNAGVQNYIDGYGSSANFDMPENLASRRIDSMTYVIDGGGKRVRELHDDQLVKTLAGSIGAGTQDGMGTNAGFNELSDIAIPSGSSWYIYGFDLATTTPSKIRAIKLSDGEVTTVTTVDGSHLNQMATVLDFVDTPEFYISDTNSNRIIRVRSNGSQTNDFIGTSGQSGSDDGIGAEARFEEIGGITYEDDLGLFISDVG
mmetsp:Transcript_20641/g.50674  ORF Transcript_20641/g.50674 Transcript_20641/m.50674 type:complete len:335 (-) Transcript_20641:32-1036(-)